MPALTRCASGRNIALTLILSLKHASQNAIRVPMSSHVQEIEAIRALPRLEVEQLRE